MNNLFWTWHCVYNYTLSKHCTYCLYNSHIDYTMKHWVYNVVCTLFSLWLFNEHTQSKNPCSCLLEFPLFWKIVEAQKSRSHFWLAMFYTAPFANCLVFWWAPVWQWNNFCFFMCIYNCIQRHVRIVSNIGGTSSKHGMECGKPSRSRLSQLAFMRLLVHCWQVNCASGVLSQLRPGEFYAYFPVFAIWDHSGTHFTSILLHFYRLGTECLLTQHFYCFCRSGTERLFRRNLC